MSDESPVSPSLQPHQRQSAANFVMERLCEMISNDLSPGDRLPPQRELADRLNVSLPSVREPLATLQAIGVIDVRHGRGMFVNEQPALGTLLQTLTSILMRDVSIEELFAVRETIELENCRNAALLIDDQHRELLTEQCRILVATETEQEFVNADVEFHLLIGTIARNRLWVLILDMVRTMIESVLRALPPQYELANEQHRAITEAIVAGDPDAAVETMKAHLAINLEGLGKMDSEALSAEMPWRLSTVDGAP